MLRRIVIAVMLVVLPMLAVPGAYAQTADLGRIDFPTSGAPEAQEHFIRGALLLHSFEYDDAAEAFREAQRLDPDFAMAYWGEAMTYNHTLWDQQDREAAREVMERLGATAEARLATAPNEREKGYLAALEYLYGDGTKLERDRAYAAAMRRLHQSYPDDDEAQAFYALAILGTAHDGRDHATYMRAAAQAEEVFRDNPRHPGAVHYLIHSYDDPVHAPLGLRAARAYSAIAPAASHAQHMISHIFVALGYWDDVVIANERAVQVADERIQRKGLPADARNYHALHWLAYGYLQQGRYDNARRLLSDMRDDAEKSGSRRARGYLAAMRATYLVNTNRWHDGAAEIQVDVSGLSPAAVAGHHFADGMAALALGDRATAKGARAAIRERVQAADASDGSTYAPGLQAARVMEMELKALLLRDAGADDDAIELLRAATALEDEIPYEYGPPRIVKPSHELLGELLLAQNDANEARAAFEAALARAPRRTESLLGLARAAERAGDVQAAHEAYATLAEIWADADTALPEVREARTAGTR
jgi:cytochrome c-type biogenesis protein CcmH/NrfG